MFSGGRYVPPVSGDIWFFSSIVISLSVLQQCTTIVAISVCVYDVRRVVRSDSSCSSVVFLFTHYHFSFLISMKALFSLSSLTHVKSLHIINYRIWDILLCRPNEILLFGAPCTRLRVSSPLIWYSERSRLANVPSPAPAWLASLNTGSISQRRWARCSLPWFSSCIARCHGDAWRHSRPANHVSRPRDATGRPTSLDRWRWGF